MTARENILAYFVTLLSVPAVENDAAVFRSRQEALAREEGSAIIVQPEEENVTLRARNIDLALRDLVVLVTVITRATSGANVTPNLTADQVADPIFEALHLAIMKDVTLAGRAAAVFEQSTRFDFELADQAAMAAQVRYLVKYQTRASDLAALQ